MLRYFILLGILHILETIKVIFFVAHIIRSLDIASVNEKPFPDHRGFINYSLTLDIGIRLYFINQWQVELWHKFLKQCLNGFPRFKISIKEIQNDRLAGSLILFQETYNQMPHGI